MYEYFLYGFVEVIIYCKVFMILIDRGVKMMQLFSDGIVRFCFLFLNFVDECIMVVIMFGFVFFCSDFMFNYYLSGDICVVSIYLL